MSRRVDIVAAVLLVAGAASAAPASPQCRAVTLAVAGTDAIVTGAEDIVVAPDGTAYVAAYDRRATDAALAAGRVPDTAGGIYSLDLAGVGQTIPAELVVRDLSDDFKAAHQFRPHGIDLFISDSGRRRIFAVNRQYAQSAEGVRLRPSIDVFDIDGDRLAHRNSLRDPRLCRPNDIAVRDAERFFVTNDHGACTGIARLIEDITGRPRSYVLYFDGARFVTAADGIGFANGIELRGAQLYVAATREKALRRYAVAPRDVPPTDILHRAGRIALPAAPDNLAWDERGRLYVAAHPSLFRLWLYREQLFGIETASAAAYRYDPVNKNTVALFRDDGAALSAATVAAPHGDILILGSAYEDHVMICRRNNDERAAP